MYVYVITRLNALHILYTSKKIKNTCVIIRTAKYFFFFSNFVLLFNIYFDMCYWNYFNRRSSIFIFLIVRIRECVALSLRRQTRYLISVYDRRLRHRSERMRCGRMASRERTRRGFLPLTRKNTPTFGHAEAPSSSLGRDFVEAAGPFDSDAEIPRVLRSRCTHRARCWRVSIERNCA